MSATDVTQLIHRLENLLKSLERFDNELDSDFSSLDTYWSRLDQVWGGVAYQEFVSSWNSARAMIRQYTNLSYRYEHFLQERIEALKKVEKTGGL